ncbi:hypothetical protein VKT23_010755 [Stygiomarasmius scandens]|uniref:Cerato-platanin n=1 Tax=Marasmiellus scandens TaxID=2682957 RepID=A0ABR1JDR7_9AGAR
MKFLAAAISLLPVLASAAELRFEPAFDNANGSLDTVACSTGDNGIITRFGFQTFKDLPTFPNIGAADAIKNFNSPACGTCWNITFTDANQTTTTITLTAIDVASSGFVVSQEAMDTLTGGQAVQLGLINVNATQVNATACGLSE